MLSLLSTGAERDRLDAMECTDSCSATEVLDVEGLRETIEVKVENIRLAREDLEVCFSILGGTISSARGCCAFIWKEGLDTSDILLIWPTELLLSDSCCVRELLRLYLRGCDSGSSGVSSTRAVSSGTPATS